MIWFAGYLVVAVFTSAIVGGWARRKMRPAKGGTFLAIFGGLAWMVVLPLIVYWAMHTALARGDDE